VATAVARALERPAVTDDLSALVTTEAFAALDLEARITAKLPAGLHELVGALVGGVRAGVERRLAGLLGDADVRQVIVTLVRVAHRSLMALLEGDGLGDGLSVREGEVSLNLLPLVGLGMRAAQDIGFLDDVVVPELTADGDPAQQVADLEAALGADLPAGFGQLVVYRTGDVASETSTLAAAQPSHRRHPRLRRCAGDRDHQVRQRGYTASPAGASSRVSRSCHSGRGAIGLLGDLPVPVAKAM
jgi:hypothetical protein